MPALPIPGQASAILRGRSAASLPRWVCIRLASLDVFCPRVFLINSSEED